MIFVPIQGKDLSGADYIHALTMVALLAVPALMTGCPRLVALQTVRRHRPAASHPNDGRRAVSWPQRSFCIGYLSLAASDGASSASCATCRSAIIARSSAGKD